MQLSLTLTSIAAGAAAAISSAATLAPAGLVGQRAKPPEVQVIEKSQVVTAFRSVGITLHVLVSGSTATPTALIAYPTRTQKYGVLVSVYPKLSLASKAFQLKWHRWHVQGLTSRRLANVIVLVEPFRTSSQVLALPRAVATALMRLKDP
jgi:hypothetical protein